MCIRLNQREFTTTSLGFKTLEPILIHWAASFERNRKKFQHKKGKNYDRLQFDTYLNW